MTNSIGSVSYLLDPGGQLLGARWSGGGQNSFMWLGSRLMAGYTSGAYFAHVNVLGSETHMTDWAGNDGQAILYYPWGQVWSNPGGNSLLQVYASLTLYDTANNGYVPPFRYYVSNQGRWLTPDPLAGDVMNPQSLNRYAYVLNNPSSTTDPLGLGCPPGTPSSICTSSGGTTTFLPPGGAVVFPPTPVNGLFAGGLFNLLFTYDCPSGDCSTYINNNILGLAAAQNLGFSGLNNSTPPPCADVFSLVSPATGKDLPLRVTTDFGAVDASHTTPHAGIDFAAPNGTELVLNTEGQVTFPRGYHDGFGNMLTLATGFGEFLFAHLQGNPLYLVGQFIDPRSAVAFTGNTGYSTGPHLHVELHTPGTALDYKSGRINKGNIVQPCKP